MQGTPPESGPLPNSATASRLAYIPIGLIDSPVDAALGLTAPQAAHRIRTRRGLALRYGSLCNSACGGTDYVEDAFRLRKHRHMAAVKLVGGCAHAFGEKALQVGVNRAVFLADDVPTGL